MPTSSSSSSAFHKICATLFYPLLDYNLWLSQQFQFRTASKDYTQGKPSTCLTGSNIIMRHPNHAKMCGVSSWSMIRLRHYFPFCMEPPLLASCDYFLIWHLIDTNKEQVDHHTSSTYEERLVSSAPPFNPFRNVLYRFALFPTFTFPPSMFLDRCGYRQSRPIVRCQIR